MGTKDLAALLRTLQKGGVTEVSFFPDGKIQSMKLGVAELPAVMPKAATGVELSEGFELPDLDENDEDPRTLHADIARRNMPDRPPGRPSRVVGPEVT